MRLKLKGAIFGGILGKGAKQIASLKALSQDSREKKKKKLDCFLADCLAHNLAR